MCVKPYPNSTNEKARRGHFGSTADLCDVSDGAGRIVPYADVAVSTVDFANFWHRQAHSRGPIRYFGRVIEVGGGGGEEGVDAGVDSSFGGRGIRMVDGMLSIRIQRGGAFVQLGGCRS